jgi:hypothetical protein
MVTQGQQMIVERSLILPTLEQVHQPDIERVGCEGVQEAARLECRSHDLLAPFVEQSIPVGGIDLDDALDDHLHSGLLHMHPSWQRPTCSTA